MSEWKITDKSEAPRNLVDAMMEVCTLGLEKGMSEYEVTNIKTDEVRHIRAYNENDVGDAIARGSMHK